MLQFMGLQRVRHDLATEQHQQQNRKINHGLRITKLLEENLCNLELEKHFSHVTLEAKPTN